MEPVKAAHPAALLDRPWRRPGAWRYAWGRVRAILRPPITVVAAPAALRKESDLEVRTRDGTVLRLNLYLPAGDGPWPVILSAHPYGKDALPRHTRVGWRFNVQYRAVRQPLPVVFSSETGWEAPDPVWWVERGYAVVNADLRGAGHSDGRGLLLSHQEAEDVADLVAWAASQPWSSGRVGMLGVSYLAISQYRAAALRPRGLAAIAPWEGFTDAYRDLFAPGGIEERGFSVLWQLLIRRSMRQQRDLGQERRRHPLRDAWWQSLVPDLSRIQVPMLVCASFSDHDLHTRGSFRAFQQAGSTERFAYTHRGPKWATFYGEEAKATQLAFFDRFLKSLDVPAPPRIRLEVRESAASVAEVRDEREWPLARTQWRDLYLAREGCLGEDPGPAGGVTFATRRSAAVFRYTFSADTELTGPMALRLWVSVKGASDVNLFAGVEKWRGHEYVPFEGSYGFGRERVTTGWQRAAMRELDPVASAPHQPVPALLQSQPLDGGEVVRLEFALAPSSTLFRDGETMRLVVGGRWLWSWNPLSGSFPARYRPSARARCTLHWGEGMPAALTVPVIPPARA